MKASKESICIDILRGGNVNAFVDFFYLSHRAEPNAGECDLSSKWGQCLWALHCPAGAHAAI